MHIRRHPNFPTVAEAEAHPELAYSDHLPILAKVPLTNTTALKIISLNTLGSSAYSGLHNKKDWETEAETIERYKRIANTLALSVKKHKVDVIALQETSACMETLLRTALGADWEVIFDKKAALMTCYNKKHFQETAEGLFDEAARIRSLYLQDIKTKAEIDFHNIWGIYNPFPQKTEEQYRKLLQKSARKNAVLIGDTNSRIAPLDLTPRNITTGIVPVLMNAENGAEPEYQIPDYPDGGFLKDEDEIIHQLDTRVLDFATGDIIEDDRELDKLDAWTEFRMILCLDDHYQRAQVINNQTIFEYQEKLRKELGRDNDLIVRMASDSFNHKAVAVRFSKYLAKSPDPLYGTLKELLKDEEGFQFRVIVNRAGNFNCVFAPLEKANILHQTIKTVTEHHSVIHDLKEYIEQRNAETGIMGFFRNLSRLNQQVKTTAAQKVIDKLLGKEVEFTILDFDALHDSKLGKLVADHKQTNPGFAGIFDKAIAKSKASREALNRQGYGIKR